MTKKRILIVLSFICCVLFVFYIVSVIRYTPLANPNQQLTYIRKGAYHLHSLFSDGSDDIHAICRDAARAHLDFIILTDHGHPNLESVQASGRHDGVLVLGGSELSLNCGHLAAAGFSLQDYRFPPEPQPAIDDVISREGICFVAHPFDPKIPWTDWNIHAFSGIEIISMYQKAKSCGVFQKLIFPLQYILNSDYALNSILNYPEKEMEYWDRFLKNGKYWGIYALDAHGRFPLAKSSRLPFPAYYPLFRTLTLYVAIDPNPIGNPQDESRMIIAAMKAGHFYSVIESIANANGFNFMYKDHNGQAWPAGSGKLAARGQLQLTLPFPFPTQAIIKRNGRTWRQVSNSNTSTVAIDVEENGIYRAEIYAAASYFHSLPWIITNPIWIGVSPERQPELQINTPDIKMVLPVQSFEMEKNNASIATLQFVPDSIAGSYMQCDFKLRYETPGNPNFWIALALRKEYNASSFNGITCEIKGNRKLHLWIVIRDSHELNIAHSISVNDTWQRIVLPFTAFHNNFKADGRMRFDLPSIRSLFIKIDSDLAYSETTGSFQIRHAGFY